MVHHMGYPEDIPTSQFETTLCGCDFNWSEPQMKFLGAASESRRLGWSRLGIGQVLKFSTIETVSQMADHSVWAVHPTS